MKLFVSLALLAASSALVAQQVAKATPPVPASDVSSSNAAEPSTPPGQVVDTPKLLPSVAASESSSAVEALIYAPAPKISEPKPVFSRKLYMTELAAYTVPNVLDGITTVRGVRRGFTESPWPRGSEELLGSRPGIGRYTATMGGLEVAVAFASYHLQHSQNRYLRLMGHSLMAEGAIDHTIGFASNLTLPNRPGQ